MQIRPRLDSEIKIVVLEESNRIDTLSPLNFKGPYCFYSKARGLGLIKSCLYYLFAFNHSMAEFANIAAP